MIYAEGNPAGIKAMLKKRNICSDEVRLPLVKVSANLQSEISNFIGSI